jgi:hypothetical protein
MAFRSSDFRSGFPVSICHSDTHTSEGRDERFAEVTAVTEITLVIFPSGELSYSGRAALIG